VEKKKNSEEKVNEQTENGTVSILTVKESKLKKHVALKKPPTIS